MKIENPDESLALKADEAGVATGFSRSRRKSNSGILNKHVQHFELFLLVLLLYGSDYMVL